MKPVVSLRKVEKRFGGRTVIAGVDLDVERGRTYALVGPNGCGKSVLLKLMCGLLEPSSGTVTIDPQYLDRGRTYPDRFGAMIDGPAYLPDRTGFQNLLDLARIRKRIDEDGVRDVLNEIGLDPASRTKAKAFSLGMKQRLGLAQAFMEDPEVLLLDEPFNALDQPSVERLTELIRERQARGVTIVFTSHYRIHVDELSDEVLEIRDGRVSVQA